MRHSSTLFRCGLSSQHQGASHSHIGSAQNLHLVPATAPRIRTSQDSDYDGPDGPAENHDSAQHVVPLVSSLIHPSSVVDVGCGSGAWLGVVRKHGAGRILDLDGDNTDPACLCIPAGLFPRRGLEPAVSARGILRFGDMPGGGRAPPEAIRSRMYSLAGRVGAGGPFLGGGAVARRHPSCQRALACIYWQGLLEKNGIGCWT